MSKGNQPGLCRVLPLAVTLAGMAAALLAALPALAQDGGAQLGKDRPTVSRAKPTSPNATINLVNLLVKQGVLTEEQAATLIKQAEDEAYVAREAAKGATAKADEATKTATAAAAAASPPGTKRVTYVPEIVKRELREEIRKEVMAKAKADGWVAPNVMPEWVSRIHFSGDMRVRYEGDFFPKGNDQLFSTSAVNYNAINTGNPFDVASISNTSVWPTNNVSENRNRLRVRARFGLDADLYDGFTAGMRIGTGENNSPVSQNQTLGGTGGNFSKYAVWLDRGFIKYQPAQDFAVTIGRMDNPFFSPTDLVWYKDIGFDGAAAQAKYQLTDWFTPFAAAGAFPIFNTDFNVGTQISVDSQGNSTVIKLPSHDKYLFAAQVGFIVKPLPDYTFKLGASYYDFKNVQGQFSSPCTVRSATDTCDTDLTRPSFSQRGNTYFALRSINPDANNNFGQTNQLQFFGLASKFQNVVLGGQLDIDTLHPVHVILDGEFVANVAFNRSDAAAKAVLLPLPLPNPFNPTIGNPTAADYAGGNLGYFARLTVGHPEMKQLWDWNISAAYKYLESDAVIDAFTDPDFGLGGTNLKGYIIAANLGLGPSVWLTAKWMSANQIVGTPFAVDVLQVDLNGKF